MEPRHIMEDIIIKRSGSAASGERPRRSIREITRDMPSRETPRPSLDATHGTPNQEQKKPSTPSFPFPEQGSGRFSDGERTDIDDLNPDVPPPRTKRSMGMWVLAFLSSLVLVFAASTYFYRVNVLVVPTENTAVVSGDFIAYKDTRPGGIKMSTITISDEKEMVVNASGMQDVARKASGTIVIYNSYSKNSQRLIKNTRFETSTGIFTVRVIDNDRS